MRWNSVIDMPRAELSKYAPGISSVKIDPEKIGLLIGKGGETIRACRRSSSPRSTSTTRAWSSCTPPTGSWAMHWWARISSMTKEVEVGDEFTGKVVKTTTFGAFVELSKGTDGLLHISNVAPGQRIATVEEVLNKGDEVAVKVVEVDRERGRIGLRLASDPEIQGKNKEELAGIAAAEATRSRGDRGGSRDRDRGPRNGDRGGSRDRDRGPRDGDRGRVRDRDPERPRS